jgi:glutaminyl-peptide cyclotransferase
LKRLFSLYRKLYKRPSALTAAACFLFISLTVSCSSPPAVNGGAAQNRQAGEARGAKLVSHEVIASYPHDPTAFLQGLVWWDGGFYESTGQYGQSSLRRVEFPSGRVIKKHDLSPELFGEGLALAGDRLIQLTWQTGRGFVYERETFNLIQEFRYTTEGWGLTYDGASLILSDGTSELTFLDPQTFKPTRKLKVMFNAKPLDQINELEFVEGEIWANVWHSDFVIRIDPATGQVNSYLNLKDIRPPETTADPEAVLNGIAYDPSQKRIFVSGKHWPRIFEIKLK